MCHLIYRTYRCETLEGGPRRCNDQATWPEERCRVAQERVLEYCGNLRRRNTDYRNPCYGPSCCLSRIGKALGSWCEARIEANGGYDSNTASLGANVMWIAYDHIRVCGLSVDCLTGTRKDYCDAELLSDDRLPGNAPPGRWPLFKRDLEITLERSTLQLALALMLKGVSLRSLVVWPPSSVRWRLSTFFTSCALVAQGHGVFMLWYGNLCLFDLIQLHDFAE